MKISMHLMASDSFVAGLESLSKLLDKGAAFAKSQNVDLVNARLAPDMFTLAQQVQQACRYAKDGMSRLSGHEPNAADGVGTSFRELKENIDDAVRYVRGISAAEFEDSEERDCSIEPPNANIVIRMDGLRFLQAWALPHFYFHVVTAYDILRHAGVIIGKPDYASWIGAFVEPRR